MQHVPRANYALFFFVNFQSKGPRKQIDFAVVLHTLCGFGNSSTHLAHLTKHNVVNLSTNSTSPFEPIILQPHNTFVNIGSQRHRRRKTYDAQTTHNQNLARGTTRVWTSKPGPARFVCNSHTTLKHHTTETTLRHFWWRLLQCAKLSH